MDAVRRATRRLDPPTVSNLIAIAAPAHGRGAYTRAQVEHVLTTAHTGFAAAVLETDEALGPGARAVVHTGFWGCGAFGGNRVLMSALQVLAAHTAGVHRLVFHAVDAAGAAQFARAQQLLDRDLLPPGRPADVAAIVTRLVAMNFPWGTSDGN